MNEGRAALEPDSRPDRRSRTGKSGHASAYVRLDTKKCQACWDCIAECKYQALGKLNIWFHKHAVFKDPDQCRGCGKCVAVCKNRALTMIKRPGKGEGRA